MYEQIENNASNEIKDTLMLRNLKHRMPNVTYDLQKDESTDTHQQLHHLFIEGDAHSEFVHYRL